MPTRPKPPEPPLTLARPSESAKLAAKMQGGQGATLAIRVDRTTLRAIHKVAVNRDKTVRQYVLELLAADGVAVAESDLRGDRG